MKTTMGASGLDRALDFLARHPYARMFATLPWVKVPPAGSHGLDDATSDPDDLRALVKRARRLDVAGEPNLALVYGNDWLVIEHDQEHVVGDGVLQELLDRVGLPSETWTIGARRGAHRVYRLPASATGRLSTLTTREGVEIRTGRRYSLLPGSRVAYGDAAGVWTYSDPYPEREVVVASEEAVEALVRLHGERNRPRRVQASAQDADDVIRELVAAHLDGAVEGRNLETLALAHDCIVRGIGMDDLLKHAEHIATTFGGRRAAGPFTAREVEQAITNAYSGRRAATAERVEAILAKSEATPWPPGSTSKVLTAMCNIALRAGTVVFTASERQVAEMAGVSQQTAGRHLQVLVDGGWLTFKEDARNRLGLRFWTLIDSAVDKDGSVGREGIEKRCRSPIDPSVSKLSVEAAWPADDNVFRTARSGGLGPDGRRALLVFARADGPLDAAALAAGLGRKSIKTGQRWIARLADAGLVVPDGAGWRLAPGRPSELLDAAASHLNVEGIGEAQRRRHAQDRRTYREVARQRGYTTRDLPVPPSRRTTS
jgi:hypothetical protein